MDGFNPPSNSPADARNGLSLLQQVRGRYLSIHYDVPALLMSYVRLLDQLGIMTGEMRTCKLQCRLLYESHGALYHLLKKMHIDSSETRAAEIRFAGGLELAWHTLKPLHTAVQEYKTFDDIESWFRHGVIADKLTEMWKLLHGAFVEFRDELHSPVDPFIALSDTYVRVLVVPGQAEVAHRQVLRADQLELPKLFRTLVEDLDSNTSLLFMKDFYIEEFMEAMQKEMNRHPMKSQQYKLYDERLQQLHQWSKILPPVHVFDPNDIRQTGTAATSENPRGSVWKGRTTTNDLVSIKVLSAFSSPDDARQTLIGEVQKWNRLRHPGLQRVLGIWRPPGGGDRIYGIISKGIKRGELGQYIQAHPKVDRVQLLLDVALGLQYLHSKNIPHGDIRGINVLMKENGEPVLTNFGLMHALEAGCGVHTAMALLELGSVRWMAPEVYDAELIGKGRGSPSLEADCHSFGMLILEIFTTQHPFAYILQDPVVVIELVRGGRPIRPTQAHSLRNPTFQPVEDSLWLLCEGCWAFPPENRLTVVDIVNTIRNHQHASRLEESRSRVGGNLLTLPAPPNTERDLIRSSAESPSYRLGLALHPDVFPTQNEITVIPVAPLQQPQESPTIEYIAQTPASIPRSRVHSKLGERSIRRPVSRASRLTAAAQVPLPSDGGADYETATVSEAIVRADSLPSYVTEHQQQEEAILGGGVEDDEFNVWREEQAKHPLGSEAVHTEARGGRVDGRSAPSERMNRQETFDIPPLIEGFDAHGAAYDPPTQDLSPPKPASSQSSAPQFRISRQSPRGVALPVSRVMSPTSTSARSPDSDKTVRPGPQPGAMWRATPRMTTRPTLVESARSSSSSSVGFPQQPSEVRSAPSVSGIRRPRSSSQHSQSQASGPSKSSIRTARSSRHPDLARMSQIPLLAPSTSSLMEFANPSGMVANRLSTIPDVTDGEEAMAHAQAQQHAEDEAYDSPWFGDSAAKNDWEFLRLVDENRTPEVDDAAGKFGTGSGGIADVEANAQNEAVESTLESSEPGNQFPPAPDIIRTPAVFGVSKDLPPLPPTSAGGSQWWQERLEGEEDPRSPTSVDSKGKKKSDDSVISAIPLSRPRTVNNFATPRMFPLPLSSIGQHTDSTELSQSLPPKSAHISVKSSAVSARGSLAKERYENLYGGARSPSRKSGLKGNKTNSTVSYKTQIALNQVAEAVCTVCGRVFAAKDILGLHIQRQGGQCIQRNLTQDLDFVGASDDELEE